MRIAVTYGPMCLMRSTEETWSDPRTGSEIGWRRIVEGLKSLGHDACRQDGGDPNGHYDAVVAVNEPDQLRLYPRAKLRICMFWLNGFSFCKEGYDDHVDLYFSPSEAHRKMAVGAWKARRPEKWGTNYLGCDPPDGLPSRIPGRAVYCSSPDRGLHRVLEAWPRIKRAVPHASLRIFYRIEPWLRQFDETPYFPDIERNRTRALYIEEALKRLSDPKWGITVVDSVSHAEVLSEMRQAEVLLYPVETMSWSEGFSCATMDACSVGCVPIITDCDAMGDVYRTLDPVPVGSWDEWRDRAILALRDDAFRVQLQAKATALAAENTWSKHVERLDALLRDRLQQSGSGKK